MYQEIQAKNCGDFGDLTDHEKEMGAFKQKGSGKRLSLLANRVLSQIEYHSGNTPFLFLEDLLRILPYKKRTVHQCLRFLENVRLLKAVKIHEKTYYCLPNKYNVLKSQTAEISINEQVNEEIQQAISKCVQKLFPGALKQGIEEYSCYDSKAVEGHEYATVYFDLVREFESPIRNKQFVAIDCHTRTPITRSIIQSFEKKIRYSRNTVNCKHKSSANCFPLRDRTIGILVGDVVSGDAIIAARKSGISLLSLGELGIDISRMHEQVVST